MSDLALDLLTLGATMYALLVALVYNLCRTGAQVPQDRESEHIASYLSIDHDNPQVRELKAGTGIRISDQHCMTIWIADHDDAPTLVTEKTLIDRQLKAAFGCPCQEKHHEA